VPFHNFQAENNEFNLNVICLRSAFEIAE
jgi:hypothetical protein